MTQIININKVQTMTSLEIAELTGKQHKDVMKAIRNMEPAWVKVCGRNFALTSRTIIQPNGGTREPEHGSADAEELAQASTGSG